MAAEVGRTSCAGHSIEAGGLQRGAVWLGGCDFRKKKRKEKKSALVNAKQRFLERGPLDQSDPTAIGGRAATNSKSGSLHGTF